MTHEVVEEVWHLLNIFNGLGYMVVLVVAMIWLRLLLRVVEYTVEDLSRHPPSVVHPLPESDLPIIAKYDQPIEFCATHEKKVCDWVMGKPEVNGTHCQFLVCRPSTQ